jgi:DNA-binding GntR family transcriptional regulator
MKNNCGELVVPPGEALVKQALADRLRREIVNGALRPGERIVEGTWGRTLGVAQASIREAIHILVHEGFVTKAAGRSARVVNLSEADVLELYAVRGALEGLAARLAAARTSDVSSLQQWAEAMRAAARRRACTELLDSDLQFHLELCRLSGNSQLVEHARKLLLPLFAFVRIQVMASGQDTSMWDSDLEAHQRIVDLIGEGEGDVAEQYVRRVMARFAATAYSNWQKRAPARVQHGTAQRIGGTGAVRRQSRRTTRVPVHMPAT